MGGSGIFLCCWPILLIVFVSLVFVVVEFGPIRPTKTRQAKGLAFSLSKGICVSNQSSDIQDAFSSSIGLGTSFPQQGICADRIFSPWRERVAVTEVNFFPVEVNLNRFERQGHLSCVRYIKAQNQDEAICLVKSATVYDFPIFKLKPLLVQDFLQCNALFASFGAPINRFESADRHYNANHACQEQADIGDVLRRKQTTEIALRVILGPIFLCVGCLLIYCVNLSGGGRYRACRFLALYILGPLLVALGLGAFFLPIYWQDDCKQSSEQDKVFHGAGTVTQRNEYDNISFVRLKQFANLPDMVANPSFHSGGHSQGLMYAAEIVPSEIQSQHRIELLPIFRESIGQASKSAHVHSHREVLTLDMRSADLAHVGMSEHWNLLAADTLGRRVPGFTLEISGVQFHQLREVNPLRPEAKNNGVLVRSESVRSYLKTTLCCRSQFLCESYSVPFGAPPQVPSEHQLAVTFNSRQTYKRRRP